MSKKDSTKQTDSNLNVLGVLTGLALTVGLAKVFRQIDFIGFIPMFLVIFAFVYLSKIMSIFFVYVSLKFTERKQTEVDILIEVDKILEKIQQDSESYSEPLGIMQSTLFFLQLEKSKRLGVSPEVFEGFNVGDIVHVHKMKNRILKIEKPGI